MAKTFAELMKEHSAYCEGLINQAQGLIKQAEEGSDFEKGEQLVSEAEKWSGAIEG